MAIQVDPIMTIADLDLLPDDSNRYEIIEGELLVSRAPSLTHQRISGNLFSIFRTYLDHNPLGEILATPGLVFDDFNGVIPDLVFISYERRDEIATGERITGAPDLIIEIVSPGSGNEKRDKVAKRQLYGRYGVKEYWIVDPVKKVMEVYSLQGQTLKLAATLSGQEVATSDLLPGLSCSITKVFSI